jgi:hypothetical protein
MPLTYGACLRRAAQRITVRGFPSARDLPRDGSENPAQPEKPARKAGHPEPRVPRESRSHQPSRRRNLHGRNVLAPGLPVVLGGLRPQPGAGRLQRGDHVRHIGRTGHTGTTSGPTIRKQRDTPSQPVKLPSHPQSRRYRNAIREVNVYASRSVPAFPSRPASLVAN